MQVEANLEPLIEETPQIEEPKNENLLTPEDLALLCDLFYLPFEHGGQGLQLLQEFNWLKSNAQLVIGANQAKGLPIKPEVS